MKKERKITQAEKDRAVQTAARVAILARWSQANATKVSYTARRWKNPWQFSLTFKEGRAKKVLVGAGSTPRNAFLVLRRRTLRYVALREKRAG